MAGEEMAGIALIIMAVPIGYMFWQFARIYKPSADEMELQSAYYMIAVKNNAKKKGIDLDKEIEKTRMFKQLSNKRNFYKEMKAEIMNDLFGKEKEEKK